MIAASKKKVVLLKLQQFTLAFNDPLFKNSIYLDNILFMIWTFLHFFNIVKIGYLIFSNRI